MFHQVTSSLFLNGFTDLSVPVRGVLTRLGWTARHCSAEQVQQVKSLDNELWRLCRGLRETQHTKHFLPLWSGAVWRTAPSCSHLLPSLLLFISSCLATFHVSMVWAQAQMVKAGSTDSGCCPLTSNCGHLSTAVLTSGTINYHSASWCLIHRVRLTSGVHREKQPKNFIAPTE